MKPPHDESADGSSDTPPLLCRICKKPVPIETARTDSDGKTVHGDCYAQEINHRDGHAKQEKRSWSAIAKELSQEQDTRNFDELAKELIEALDQAEAERHPPMQKKPDRAD